MDSKMELLAPAGSSEALHAAVENGADAVYLGGKLFNARQLAGNFDGRELSEAIRYAHIRGVRIYLTMNTLISDTEMEEALEFAADSWAAGVDAFIVQDIGFAAALRRLVPDIQLHASTQMTIYNPEGVEALESMGFKRVVLARELSFEEISRINRTAAIETEVFVHGALCISYSGQCLMSSIIGGRSGNRGKCAQPCRLPYSLAGQVDKNMPPSYLLSPKDLCLLTELERLSDAGVRSLKIEGRMKSPEYVATVVRIYRKYLDILQERKAYPDVLDGSKARGLRDGFEVEERDLRDLKQIFNRGGFTKGYFDGKPGRDMMCFEKPKNWGIYVGKALSADRSRETFKLRLAESLSIGDGIEVWNGEDKSPGTIVTSMASEGTSIRTGGKGDVVTVGSIQGRIPAGSDVYKTSDRELNSAAAETYTGKPLRKVRLKGKAALTAGRPLILTVWDEEGNEVSALGSLLPEAAVNRPVTAERLAEQLGKTGSTPFELKDIVIDLEEGLSIPVSEINDVRRKALEELEQKRAAPPVRPMDKSGIPQIVQSHPGIAIEKKKPGISMYFYKLRGDVDYSALKADRLYLPFGEFQKAGSESIVKACREAGTELFLWLPSVTRGNYDILLKKWLEKDGHREVDGVLAGNPGTVKILENAGNLRLAGDLGMNIFNRLSLREAADLGLESVMLSAELTAGQAGAIAGSSPTADGSPIANGSPIVVEAAVYGRLPLMTSEYCPVGCTEGGFASGRKCSGSCGTGGYRLVDRMGMEFPVLCDRIDCRSTILNSNVLFLPDSLKRLADSGVGLFRLYIYDEAPETIKKLSGLHRRALEGKLSGELEGLVESIKAKGFTKGHYFRGV